MSEKPKEFWINEDYCTSSMVPDESPDTFHLIEKSAYDQVIKMLKNYSNCAEDFGEIEELLKELGEME